MAGLGLRQHGCEPNEHERHRAMSEGVLCEMEPVTARVFAHVSRPRVATFDWLEPDQLAVLLVDRPGLG